MIITSWAFLTFTVTLTMRQQHKTTKHQRRRQKWIGYIKHYRSLLLPTLCRMDYIRSTIT